MSLLMNRWNELADVKDELAARDWFRGTSGNLSIKVTDSPLTFLVSASGKDKYKRTDEDFLLVNENGEAIETKHLKPSAEMLLHREIYHKTDAGCSIHVHTIDNNVISELYGDKGEIVFQGQELIKAFDLWEEDATYRIPIVKNHANIPMLAKTVSEQVTNDAGAVLIRNHGITVWGRSAFEAKKYLEACEFLFSYQVKLLTLRQLVQS